jgi:hypothetical protein
MGSRLRPLPLVENVRVIAGLRTRPARMLVLGPIAGDNREKIIRLIFAILATKPECRLLAFATV